MYYMGMERAKAPPPIHPHSKATPYFVTWCLSPYSNHGAYNKSIIAEALANYCYFHGQVHGYYRALRSLHPSSRVSPTHWKNKTRLTGGGGIAACIAARRAVNSAPTVPNSPHLLLLKNKPKPKTISLVSLTDAGGGVDEIQDGCGE